MQQVIYLAGGCFWGIQGYFDLVRGVVDSEVGYANSKIENPSYELVCSGITGAVEDGKTIEDWKRYVFPHPTVGEIFREL